MKLLDCTLRDGGYYTLWNFSKKMVERYLVAMSAAKVDVVELGLRNFPKPQFLGAHAYTVDSYINSLDIPEGLEIGVMVDAKTLLSYDGPLEEGIDTLFSPASESKVSLVRVAAHFTEVDKCDALTKALKALGYTVGFNLMQSGGRSEEQLREKAKAIKEWNSVDVLYFADSLGNMDTVEVKRIYDAIKLEWEGDIGIHTHNNKGQALQNSMASYDLGIEWLDSTITGMGRGAGNTATELLTLELQKLDEKYRSEALWKVVMDDFMPLQREHGWGASFLYHYAADKDIHPTYVQSLLSDGRYTSEQVIQALQFIAPFPTSSFDSKLLAKGVSGLGDISPEGTWDANNWCQGKDILLLGAGKSLVEHKSAIEDFIKRKDILTLSLNVHHEIDNDLIDYYISVDPIRMSLEINEYKRLNKPLFTPVGSFQSDMLSSIKNLDIRDYGMDIDEQRFVSGSSSCVVPAKLSIAYAFALAQIGNANKIWLVGFDGYSGDDPRQDEMLQVLDIIKQSGFNLTVTCLTPSNYPLAQGSVYAPY